MAGSFSRRVTALRQTVGGGELVGSVTVDQVYAKYQHERLDLRHPLGGGAKYLENPLKEKHRRYLEALADAALETGPSAAMVRVVEDLAGEVGRRAPVEEGTLRASAHPRVLDAGAAVYDRPGAPRTEEG